MLVLCLVSYTNVLNPECFAMFMICFVSWLIFKVEKPEIDTKVAWIVHKFNMMCGVWSNMV